MAHNEEFKSKEISDKLDWLLIMFENTIESNKNEIINFNNSLFYPENNIKQINYYDNNLIKDILDTNSNNSSQN